MNIVFINHYASTPATGMGGRHHYLARELARLGHKVTVISATYSHLLHSSLSSGVLPTDEILDGYRILRLRVCRYKNAHDKRRILAWVLFSAQLPFVRRSILKKNPDVVIYSSPHLLGYLGAAILAYRYGSRLVFEVRDLWPKTLVDIGGFSGRSVPIKFLQWIEDFAYAKSCMVISTMESAINHIVERGGSRDRFTWIPNGISLEEVGNPKALPLDFENNIPAEGFRVIYCGTIGAANALDVLIEAAALLQDFVDINFLIVGEGRSRKALEENCKALGIHNVHFLGVLSKAQIQDALQRCDACYLGWRLSGLYRWGISANKLPEYLYSGKPVIHSYSGSNDPVAKFKAGLTVPAGDPKALALAVVRLRDMSQDERAAMGANGREAALEYYDYAKLAKRLEKVLSSCVGGNPLRG